MHRRSSERTRCLCHGRRGRHLSAPNARSRRGHLWNTSSGTCKGRSHRWTTSGSRRHCGAKTWIGRREWHRWKRRPGSIRRVRLRHLRSMRHWWSRSHLSRSWRMRMRCWSSRSDCHRRDVLLHCHRKRRSWSTQRRSHCDWSTRRSCHSSRRRRSGTCRWHLQWPRRQWTSPNRRRRSKSS